MHRFFTEPDNIRGRYIFLTDRGDLHHLRSVLRMSAGDELEISDGAEWEYRARIEEMTQDQAKLLILDKQKFAVEPDIHVTLYQGIPKASKMETVIQKTVELGVYRIVPVFTERTVTADRGNFAGKLERWRKISCEAAGQCRRGVIPQVAEAADFASMMDELPDYDLVLFPYENEDRRTIKDCLTGAAQREVKPKEICMIIGPEGGFSDREASLLQDAGAESVSLGKTTLRTETAGPAALAMVMYALEM